MLRARLAGLLEAFKGWPERLPGVEHNAEGGVADAVQGRLGPEQWAAGCYLACCNSFCQCSSNMRLKV